MEIVKSVSPPPPNVAGPKEDREQKFLIQLQEVNPQENNPSVLSQKNNPSVICQAPSKGRPISLNGKRDPREERVVQQEVLGRMIKESLFGKHDEKKLAEYEQRILEMAEQQGSNLNLFLQDVDHRELDQVYVQGVDLYQKERDWLLNDGKKTHFVYQRLKQKNGKLP